MIYSLTDSFSLSSVIVLTGLLLTVKVVYSVTPERWIWHFYIAIIATANSLQVWHFLPCFGRKFSIFWPKKIYSPSDWHCTM